MNKVYEQMKSAVVHQLKNRTGELSVDDTEKIVNAVFNQLVADGTLKVPEDEDAYEAIMYLVTDLS